MTDSFVRRMSKFGLKNLFLAPDFIIGAITLVSLILYSHYFGNIGQEIANAILDSFIQISVTLFSIILAALAIVASFTDEKFILAWIEIDEFDNLITLFQYNLYVPLSVMILSLFSKYLFYSPWIFIFICSLFVYMLISLIDLIGLVSKYALQRGKFIEIMHGHGKQQE